MKRPARFTQAEMVRALKAIAQAGVAAFVEVTTEGIRVVPGKGRARIEKEEADDEKVLML